MQVTIYRVDSGFRNVPDGLTLSEPSSDVNYSSAVYDLPDGYTVDVAPQGQKIVVGPKGQVMSLAPRNARGNSAVLMIDDHDVIALKKAKADAAPAGLRAVRIAAGLTQQQLADASGVNIRQIQRVELGSSDAGNLTARNLLAIADALGIDPHDLI